jgi:biopolymer transport protein ExbB
MEQIIKFIEAGGPLMYPMTVVGLLIFTLGIYQVIWLLLWTFSAKKYACQGAPKWTKKAIEMAISKKGLTGVSLIESIEICIARAEGCLLKRVPDMKFLAQISTLMGFLGTVTGMVKVFNTVAKLGMVTPSDLAGGIHEALFTTVYGLALALFAWGFSYFIEVLAHRHIRAIEMRVFSELDAETSKESVEK